jgi:hypothetical protein
MRPTTITPAGCVERIDAVKLRIRYSLRVFLLCFTVLAIWLGARANVAFKQRRAVVLITDSGGYPYYDWQLNPIYDADGNVDYYKIIRDTNAIPAPRWLRALIGDEFFQNIVKVTIHTDRVNDQIITTIRELPKLNEITLSWRRGVHPDNPPKMTREQLDELKQLLRHKCPQASVWSPGLSDTDVTRGRTTSG